MSRIVESLLDDAEAAVTDHRWGDVAELAQDALLIDPNSTEARRLLELATRRVDTADSRTGRRQVTIIFADMVGSTPLSERLDLEDYTRLVRRYQRACRRAVERYGGSVNDEQGDGMLAVFGYPVASGDDAVRAVASAVQLVDEVAVGTRDIAEELDEEVHVRAGVHTGLMVADDEGHLYGSSVNIAARIQDQARPGTVVMSALTRAMVGDSVEASPLGHFDLKGVDEPVQLFEATSVVSAGKLLAAERIVPIVGRSAEFAALRSAWHMAQTSGEGSVSLIVGEAGIGKSRLAEELRRETDEAGHPTVLMQATSFDAPAALHPVIRGLADSLRLKKLSSPDEVIARLRELVDAVGLDVDRNLPVLATLFDLPADLIQPPPLEPAQLREAQLALLCDILTGLGRSGPHLLILEDLHWADPTTVDLLGRVIDAGLPAGVCLVVTSRPGVDRLQIPRQVTTELHALGAEESRQLAHALAPVDLDDSDIARVAERSDGVPLFIEQLIAGTEGAGAVPPSLADLFQSRLDATGPSKAIAQLGATLGREFDHRDLDDALALVEGSAPDDVLTNLATPSFVHIERLINAKLIETVGGGRLRFRHSLLREAAYDSQLRSERPGRHEVVARVLAANASISVDPSMTQRIATHYEAAGRAPDAVQNWLLAAARATRTGHSAEALSFLERAEALLPDIPGADRSVPELQLLITRAGLLMGSQGFAAPGVVESFERCLQICDEPETAGDAAFEQARALLVAWTYHFNRGNLDESADVLHRLEALVDLAQFSGLRGAIDSCRGVEYVYRGRLAEARALLDIAEARFDHEDLDWATWPLPNDCLAAALANRALAEALLGDVPAATATIDKAIARAQQLPYPFGPYSTAFVRGYEAWTMQLAGQPGRSAAAAQQTVEIAQRHGFTEWIVVGTIHQAVGALLRGDAQSVLDSAGPAIELYRRSGARLALPSFDGVLAGAHLLLGDVEASTATLDDAIATTTDTGQTMLLPDLYRMKGMIAAATGDTPGARQNFNASAAYASEHGNAASLVALRELGAQFGLDMGVTSP